MRSHCRNPGGDSGFTLIEVLVALVIAGLALAAVAAVFGTGVIGHEIAADANTAVALAEEKLAGTEAISSLRAGRNGGVYAGRFDWQVSVAPYDDPGETAAAINSVAGETATLRLYRIEASVGWREGRHRRQLALSTLRLLPVPP